MLFMRVKVFINCRVFNYKSFVVNYIIIHWLNNVVIKCDIHNYYFCVQLYYVFITVVTVSVIYTNKSSKELLHFIKENFTLANCNSEEIFVLCFCRKH